MTQDDREYEDVVRNMIQHENSVMNNRITWMATLNGLLFAALGFSWCRDDSRNVITVLCFLGALVCCISGAAIIFASVAIVKLSLWWDEHRPKDYRGPGVAGIVVTKRWRGFGFTKYLSPTDFLAVVLFGGWVAILIINLYRTIPAPSARVMGL